MASLREELAADLRKAIGGYGQTFVWGATSYPCVRTPAPAGLEFEVGGETQKISERIVVARAEFAEALPQIGDGIDGDQAQIKSIDPNAENLILLIGSFDEP